MTFEQKIENMLLENGMFERQAVEVMKRLKKSEHTKSMANRWNDDIEGYPPSILVALWLSARIIALEWIDTNCPLAGYRPMFLPKAERDAILA